MLLFQAESPDEVALVLGAADANVVLIKRNSDTAQVAGPGQPAETIKILAVNEFDSKRKCMSVVIRVALPKTNATTVISNLNNTGSGDDEGDETLLGTDHQGEDIKMMKDNEKEEENIDTQKDKDKDKEGADGGDTVEWGPPLLLCKGADSSMFPSCVKDHYVETCKVHVDDFACNGLRTLVMGQKELSEETFASWIERYKVASKSLSNRKEMLRRCAEEIGRFCVLCGCSVLLCAVLC